MKSGLVKNIAFSNFFCFYIFNCTLDTVIFSHSNFLMLHTSSNVAQQYVPVLYACVYFFFYNSINASDISISHVTSVCSLSSRSLLNAVRR